MSDLGTNLGHVLRQSHHTFLLKYQKAGNAYEVRAGVCSVIHMGDTTL